MKTHEKLTGLNVLILDDDNSFLQLLKVFLSDLGIAKCCLTKSYTEAIRQFSSCKPDICILDIELQRGSKTGIDAARAIRQKNAHVPIIFLTAQFTQSVHNQIQALFPSSFVSKELSRLKLLQAIEYAMLQLENGRLRQQLAVKAAPPPPKKRKSNSGNQQIFFKIGDSFKRIDFQKINYFFAENKFTYAKVGNRKYPTTVQLKVLEDQLSPLFQRCHKKYLVNVNSIESIFTKDNKIKVGAETLPIGYHYRKPFFENLMMLK